MNPYERNIMLTIALMIAAFLVITGTIEVLGKRTAPKHEMNRQKMIDDALALRVN